MNGEKEQKFYTFLKVSAQPPLRESLSPAGPGSGQSCGGDKARATLPLLGPWLGGADFLASIIPTIRLGRP